MRFLPLLLFSLLSLTAAGQSTVFRNPKVIVAPLFGGVQVDFQIQDSTAYKTGAFWQNRGAGIGRWRYLPDSVWQSNDTLYVRTGPQAKGYKLGGGSSTFDTTSIYEQLAARITFPDLMGALEGYITASDTAVAFAALRASINAKLNPADTLALRAAILALQTGKLDNVIGNNDNNLQIVSSTRIATRKSFIQLTDGATITINASNGVNYYVTLGGTRTLAISNMQSGQCITVWVWQDATGGRELNLPAGWYVPDWATSGKAPIKTDAGKLSIISIELNGTTYAVLGGGMKQ